MRPHGCLRAAADAILAAEWRPPLTTRTGSQATGRTLTRNGCDDGELSVPSAELWRRLVTGGRRRRTA